MPLLHSSPGRPSFLPRVGQRFAFAPFFDNENTTGGTTTTTTTPPPVTTFDQEAVNKLTGKARTEGRDKAIKDLLADLGIDDLETVKSTVKRQQEADAASKTEAERLAAERDAEKQRAQRLEADMRETLIDTRIETRAQRIKVGDTVYTPKRGDDDSATEATAVILRLIDRSALTVDLTKRTVDGLDDALTTIVKQYPYLFDVDAPQQQQRSGGYAPPTPANSGKTISKQELYEQQKAAARASGKYS